MSSNQTEQKRRPFVARAIRNLSPLVILAWIAVILVTTLGSVDGDWKSAIPALEKVGEKNSVSLMPKDAPSAQAMKRMGQVFQESDSDSSAMIVIEGQEPLGDDTREYYSRLISDLRADPKHVEHVQDLWGDRLTSSSVQSPDGKATYVQLNLAGNQGTPLGDESVAAVRKLVDENAPPEGVHVYVTGAAPLASDMQHSGNKSILKITAVTVVIIFSLLLMVYRSIVTVILLLTMVGIELAAARGIVAFLGHHEVFVLSTFAVNMLVFLSIAAGTDYGIFFFGRYQEARQAGEDRETAYYSMYRGVTPVVLASGMTIAGAIFCLSFTRLPYFHTMGIPCAIGMLAAVAVAVTLVPAGIALASRFGLLDPKRKMRVRRWRGIGTAIVRWPGPVLAASLAAALVGLLALPGYKTSYNDRAYISGDIPANMGFAAAERHFSQARMQPEVLLIESDHDLRNPADFLVLNRVAKAVFKVRGVSRVQGITRPEGTPIEHTSIPFLLSLQNAGQTQALHFQRQRVDDMLKQADDMATMIAVMKRMYELMKQMQETTHSMVGKTHELKDIAFELRGSLALFDDFLRPIRSYFYWEPHCFDIPICWSLRSVFDALDTVDEIDDKLAVMVDNLDHLDAIMPEMLVQFPQMISIMETMRTMSLTMHTTMSGLLGQMDETSKDAAVMGQAFDAAKSDDSFFLPPEVFQNPDFQRAMNSFLSPDGKAVRFIISHNGDPATEEGIARTEQIKTAAEESLKGTPLVNSQISLAGTAATAKDWKDGSTYDLLIAGIAALCLIFIIMLIITRSFIAALVIVGTVALSLGASFGMSVLLWQYVLGIQLHWMVLAMSVIILLAVGSDYNLLLVSRMKEEIGAGINTGIIRAMGGTGKVVTTAGLVFAATMASMVVSDLRIIGQIGTTIGLGLMFDTLIVRAFLTPAIAALLGRWFWWPQRVRPRPASVLLRPYGPRPLVRALLDGDVQRGPDDAATAPIPRPPAG
ncbi:transporter [Mycolicibacterium mageritense DSM 44476 = CIP 104973]|uniref:Siderophore exporter MmpL4 n=1 Tax=Mycolicibacterium mageritense TaxID=53462 RepID=A0AAI8TTL1_MYCME|nr:RND family transporter [Mycolicibacterium mageritense]OKH78588.1 membrane protein [Mycobacterium sp. SWH-M3]MCC9185020.1 RND family transporter [Mycolicibacterium mageritense]TXI56215.1 MAG: RND family transporter [Mycolicibacterium mageritense]CDO21506.1 transporter [Mycolicibacterium mageritense DSM 44476 = CIP 104973]BBX33070.1 transporter [Mycolicibacterium mageritense]